MKDTCILTINFIKKVPNLLPTLVKLTCNYCYKKKFIKPFIFADILTKMALLKNSYNI